MENDDRKRWNAIYRVKHGASAEPAPFLLALDDALPRRGRALDVAGGAGANAVWLARRGLDVTLADISPAGLQRAGSAAEVAGVGLFGLEVDLEVTPLPPGPWILIVCIRFLWRPLFAEIEEALAPGGMLVVVHPTRSNLARHDRPGARHLLEDGELPDLVKNLEILRYEEEWSNDGRHEAHLFAHKPWPGIVKRN